MKKSISIKRFIWPFIILPVIVSCQGSSEKNGTKDVKPEAVAEKKETKIPSKADATKWNADATKAQVKFTVKGPFGTVHGSLSSLKSTILFDETDLSSSFIQASVDPKTISTGIKLRNRDLQKEKYLHSDDYPSINFRSEKIQKADNGYKATGKLTIKETTKSVEIPFHFTQKGDSGIFKGSFTIERSDYKIGKEGGSIGNTITVDLEVPVMK